MVWLPCLGDVLELPIFKAYSILQTLGGYMQKLPTLLSLNGLLGKPFRGFLWDTPSLVDRTLSLCPALRIIIPAIYKYEMYLYHNSRVKVGSFAKPYLSDLRFRICQEARCRWPQPTTPVVYLSLPSIHLVCFGIHIRICLEKGIMYRVDILCRHNWLEEKLAQSIDCRSQ